MNDQLAVIGNPVVFGNNHPILYNLALSGCVRFGSAVLGSSSLGMFIYVLIQMVLCSSAVAVCCAWVSWRGAPRWTIVLVVVYFALLPAISNYSISTVKDTIFAYVVLLWVPFLFEMTSRRDRFWGKIAHSICFFFLLAATALVRNNGLYVSFGIILYVLIVCRENFVRVVIPAILAIAVSLTPNIVLSSMGVQQLFRETVGIPLQQIAAVVCSDKDSLSDSQLAYVDSLIPIETIESVYAPMSVDSIKYNPSFNSDFLQKSKGEFIKVYIQIGMMHPDLYFRAWASQTWGYWSPFAPNTTQSFLFSISDNHKSEYDEAAIELWGLKNESLYPDQVSEAMSSFMYKVTWYPSPGACFLVLLLLCWLVAIRFESLRYISILVPLALLWFTLLIAVPLATAFRYAFAFAVVIPFFASVLFFPRRKMVRLQKSL